MMNKRYEVFVAVLAGLVVLAGCQSAPSGSEMTVNEKRCDAGGAKVVFASTEHDFGRVRAGAEKTCEFEFINDGVGDLVIEKIHASCGCTTTTAAQTTLAPGRASEIQVVYHASNTAGPARKRIDVYTNDPVRPEVTLWITADILGDKTPPRQTDSSKPAPEPKKKKGTMSESLKQRLHKLNRTTGG